MSSSGSKFELPTPVEAIEGLPRERLELLAMRGGSKVVTNGEVRMMAVELLDLRRVKAFATEYLVKHRCGEG